MKALRLVTFLILLLSRALVPAILNGQDLTPEEIEKGQRIRESLIERGFLQEQTNAITAQPASVDPIIDKATYANKRLSVSTMNSRATDFRPDGSQFYIVGRGTKNVVEYHLSNDWNIESATYERELDTSAEMGSQVQSGDVTNGIYIRKNDGKQMWILNRTEIWEYTLSTAWDVSSASPTGYQDLSADVVRGHDIDFKPDGTVLYVDDRVNEVVFQYDLSTPWDVETASLDDALDISDQQDEVRGIQFNQDGHRMFLMDTGRREILEYYLSSSYNISTASFIGSYDVSDQASNPRGLTFKPDFRTFYVTDASDNRVYQYKLLIIDPDKSNLHSSKVNVIADGSDTSRITVTARDADGDKLKGVDINLTSNSSHVLINSVNSTTNSKGEATFDVSNTVHESVTFEASGQGITINDNETVHFIAVDAELSSISASPNKVQANDKETSTITVTVRDEDNNRREDIEVTLFAEDGNLQVNDKTKKTDNAGEVEFDVSNDRAETVTYGAMAGGVELSQKVQVTFIPMDAELSFLEVGSPKVLANGSSETTITVFARDEDDQPFNNLKINLVPDGGSSNIKIVKGTTDSDGKAIFKVSDEVAEQIQYSAKGGGVTINQKVQVKFVPMDAELSFLERGSAKVLANGSAETTISVFARDEDNEPFSDLKIELIPGSGNSKIRKIQEVTDSKGVAKFAVSNETPQIVQYSAKGGGVTLNQTISVNFVTVDPNESSASADPEAIQADGQETSTITVVTRDQDGDVLAGAVVQLQQNGGNSVISNNPIVTNEEGAAVFKVTDTVPEIVNYRVIAEDIELPQQVSVSFIPVAPVSLAADGVETRQFIANWEMVKGADSYLLDVATDSSFSNIVAGYGALDVGNTTSHVVDGVLPGTTYLYRVRATSNGLIGANSLIINVTTFPDIPVAMAATDQNALKFTANWEAAEGARSYRLDVAKDPNFEHYVSGYQHLVVGDVLSYNVTGLDLDMTYYYRVRSIAGPRISSYSNVVETSTLSISNENSGIESEQLRVLANGEQSNLITITVLSGSGVPLEGLNVELSSDNGSSQIEKKQPVTDSDGIATFGVTNTVAEKVAYSVFAEGKNIGEIRVEFLPDEGELNLGNNFPNPFKNQTILPLTVPRPMKISLTIYNSLGVPVRNLIDGEVMETGYYEILFEGAGLASGVYFYRLIAGGKVKTKKMVMVK